MNSNKTVFSVPLQTQTCVGETNYSDDEINSKCSIDFSKPKRAANGPLGNETVDREERQETKVPDGGYGWFVVLGCFVSHVINGGLDRGDGVFFLEFQKQFGLSAQATALPGALVSALRLCFGPIASIVCNRYSVRSACVVGSVLTFLGLFLNGYAPNFYFLFLSHFLIQGVGRGLVYAPGLFLVGSYFDKRRSLATGISSSGVGAGIFFLVPLFQLIFEIYGYQGGCMLIAAIALNLSVCAMLYRPLSLHFKFTEGKEIKKTDEFSIEEGPVLANTDEVEALDTSNARSWKARDNRKRHANAINSENSQGACCKDIMLEGKNEKPLRRKKEKCLKSSLKICFPIDTYNRARGSKRKLFHFYLLKNPAFLLCCLSIMLFTTASKSAFTFIPAHVKSVGNSESKAALALSISGAFDTIGRILVGIIFDLKHVKIYRLTFFTAFIFLIATVSFILHRLEDYASICVVCGVYGFISGGCMSQKSVVIVDILGAENIANSFGLLICFQGIGTVIGPPTSGSLKDITGSFHSAFDFGGTLMLCSGFLMMLCNIFFRRQLRRSEEKE